jgi:sphinganine C4-monooxygenase
VPYAYGALYNHPFEGFLLDTLGTGLAYLLAGMTVRQSMWFFTGSTIKTVDDHCGYALPFDPLQHLTSNNAGYHDIHHQSWGIKTNFSQPFFTFWDRFLGTMWTGDVSARYEKARHAAQQKLEQEKENAIPAKPADKAATPAPSRFEDDARAQPTVTSRATRKKASSISQSPSGNFKGLRNKVNESLHGRGGAVLGVESSH